MIFALLLILNTVCLFYFYRRYKRSLSARDSFVIQLLLIGILSLFYFKIFSVIFTPDSRKALLEKEKDYMELAGEYTTEFIKRSGYAFGKKTVKILIIDFPRSKKLPGHLMSGAIIKGIKKGATKNNFKIKAIVRPKPSKNPRKYWLSPHEFDRIVFLNSDCDFVISLVGLPRLLGNVKFWKKPAAPKVLMIRGNLSRLEGAFKYKAIIGAMVFLPGISFKKAKNLNNENREDAFYNNFIFVTPGNMKNVKKDFPELFYFN